MTPTPSSPLVLRDLTALNPRGKDGSRGRAMRQLVARDDEPVQTQAVRGERA